VPRYQVINSVVINSARPLSVKRAIPSVVKEVKTIATCLDKQIKKLSTVPGP